jgi:uncharacterized membrane protein YczE
MCKFNKRKANILQMAQILKNMNPAKILEENNGAKRMALMPMSILLMGFAVSIFSYSGMGVDPFTALNMSISAKLSMSFGFFQMCVNGVILTLVAIVAKKLINLGTIFNMVGVGYVCEFFTGLYSELLPQNPSLIVKIVAMLLGVFLLSLSASLYFNCDLGVSPYDALGFVLTEKTSVKYKWCRVATDLVCTLGAFLLGGPIGIGTVITAFFMGPIISFCDNAISKKVLAFKSKLLSSHTP